MLCRRRSGDGSGRRGPSSRVSGAIRETEGPMRNSKPMRSQGSGRWNDVRRRIGRARPFWFGLLDSLSQRTKAKPDHPRPARRRHLAEPLERRLLFIATTGIADWVSDGPSPTNQGQVRGLDSQFNPVSGAVAALAPHPTNPDVLYIAS